MSSDQCLPMMGDIRQDVARGIDERSLPGFGILLKIVVKSCYFVSKMLRFLVTNSERLGGCCLGRKNGILTWGWYGRDRQVYQVSDL